MRVFFGWIVMLLGLSLVLTAGTVARAHVRHHAPYLLLYTASEISGDGHGFILAEPSGQPIRRFLEDTGIFQADFVPNRDRVLGFGDNRVNMDLFTADMLGRDLAWIPIDGDELYPVVSPTGEQVAYTALVRENMETAMLTYLQLWILNLETHQRHPIERPSSEGLGDYCWLDADTLLISTGTTILRHDLATTTTIELLKATGRRFGDLATSPDGSAVALLYYDPTIPDYGSYLAIFTPADGLIQTLPTGDVFVPQAVVWSPDGQWLYFAGLIDHASAPDLYRIRPTGRDLQQLTATPTTREYSPDVSPPIDHPLRTGWLAVAGFLAVGMGVALRHRVAS